MVKTPRELAERLQRLRHQHLKQTSQCDERRERVSGYEQFKCESPLGECLQHEERK